LKRILLFASLVLLTAKGFGQDDPTPPVVPPPVVVPAVIAELEVVGPTEFKFGDWIELEAKGGPIGPILWRFKDAAGATPQLRYPEKDNQRKIELSYRPGNWTLEVLAADTKAIETDVHTFIIEGGGPIPDPPNPPVVKTLRDLAGADVAKVTDFVAALERGFTGDKPFSSPDQFKSVFDDVSGQLGITSNAAVIECAKRFNLKTIEAIKSEVSKAVEELKAPQPPPAGKIKLIVVHETLDADAAMGRLIVNIRDGDIKKYLYEKGYGYTLILDDDLNSAIIQTLKPSIDQIGLPAVFVLDVSKDPHPILHAQKLTEAEMSTAGFLAAIKKGGA
jgi:hypothetical protein